MRRNTSLTIDGQARKGIMMLNRRILKPNDAPPLSDEEYTALKQIEPMTGKEIVEGGLLGGWADMNIDDGAEWLNDQKRKRHAKVRW